MGNKINEHSHNQFIKRIFFGESEMDKYSNKWTKWPESYKSIYSNMMNANVKMYPWTHINTFNKILKLVDTCKH